MASAVDKQPAAARLAAVAAAGCLPTATNGRQNSYTTPGDTTVDPQEQADRERSQGDADSEYGDQLGRHGASLTRIRGAVEEFGGPGPGMTARGRAGSGGRPSIRPRAHARDEEKLLPAPHPLS